MVERAFANAMIGNYRRQFKERLKRDTLLSDDQIFEAIESIGVAPDGETQDEWTVDAMIDKEDE